MCATLRNSLSNARWLHNDRSPVRRARFVSQWALYLQPVELEFLSVRENPCGIFVEIGTIVFETNKMQKSDFPLCITFIFRCELSDCGTHVCKRHAAAAHARKRSRQTSGLVLYRSYWCVSLRSRYYNPDPARKVDDQEKPNTHSLSHSQNARTHAHTPCKILGHAAKILRIVVWACAKFATCPYPRPCYYRRYSPHSERREKNFLPALYIRPRRQWHII